MSKVIILAAGRGSRLSPLTDEKPKCMVEYKNKPLIDYQLETLHPLEVNIICGYKMDVLKQYLGANIRFYENKNWEKTNMVYTLFCAKEKMRDIAKSGEDLIISYSDIIYFSDCIDLLEKCNESALIVFKQWKKLWEKRFSNILEDAESLKIKDGYIAKLGKKVRDISQIDGQYIGLIKIKNSDLLKMISLYDCLDKEKIYDGKDFNNMYMTSFINEMIDSKIKFRALEYDGILGEIDSKGDLDIDL